MTKENGRGMNEMKMKQSIFRGESVGQAAEGRSTSGLSAALQKSGCSRSKRTFVSIGGDHLCGQFMRGESTSLLFLAVKWGIARQQQSAQAGRKKSGWLSAFRRQEMYHDSPRGWGSLSRTGEETRT